MSELDLKKAIGKRIAGRRKRLKLSQEELANLLDSNQTQISRYERGENFIGGEILIDLSRALQTTTDFLLGLTDNPDIPLRNDSDLDPDEFQTIKMMRDASAEKRREMIRVMKALIDHSGAGA
jgi:transcriptional regulator with XRE-family HTH domain